MNKKIILILFVYIICFNFYKSCYELCNSCTNTGDNIKHLCSSCISGYFRLEDEDYDINCYPQYGNIEGYYFKNNEFKKCYYTCKDCSEEGTSTNHNCEICNIGFYRKEDENIAFNCYPETEKITGYYFDYILFKKCFELCSECETGGTFLYGHNCKSCIVDYIALKDEDYYNCYEKYSYPQGYYYDSNNNIIKCYFTCLACSLEGNEINHNCDACENNYVNKEDEYTKFNCFEKNQVIDGYYLSNNIFKKCYSTCSSCIESGDANNNRCNSCKLGFSKKYNEVSSFNCYDNNMELDGYYLSVDEFNKCYSTCLTCKKAGDESKNNCLSCISEHFHKEDEITDFNCYKNKPLGYYLDKDILRKCYSSCSECENIGDTLNHNCKTCLSGYYPKDEDSSANIKNCYSTGLLGYYLDINLFKQCFPTCSECDKYGDNSNNNCLKCQSNYYRKEEDVNEFNCYSNMIVLEGYYFLNDLFRKCYISCEECNIPGDINNNYCIKCKSGYFKKEESVAPFDCYKNTELLQEYYFKDNLFKKCKSPCSSCFDEQTDSKHNCIKCIDNYYNLIDDSTMCYDKDSLLKSYYYDSNESIFKYCKNGCNDCYLNDNKYACNNCYLGFLYNDSCVYECPDGFYADSSKCKQCSSTCKKCESLNKCLDCIEGYIIDNDQCRIICNENEYYDYDISDCVECSISCKTCLYEVCLTCPDNKILEEGLCKEKYNDNLIDDEDNIEDIIDKFKKDETINLIEIQKDIIDILYNIRNTTNLKSIKLIDYALNITNNYNSDRNNTEFRKENEEFVDIMKAYIENITDNYIKHNINSTIPITIKTENFNIQIYSNKSKSERINEQLQKRLSILDLGNCENLIRKKLNLNIEDNLPISQIDYTSFLTSSSINNITDFDQANTKNSNTAKYKVYNPKIAEILNIDDVCSKEKINYSIPSKNYNASLYESFKQSLGVDIYNKTDNFYTNRCFSWSKNQSQSDVPLDFRRKVVTDNIIECGGGCEYQGIDLNGYTKCNCEVKISTIRNQVIQVVSLNIKANFDIVKCFIEFITEPNILKSNAGLYLYASILLIVLIITIIQINTYDDINKLKDIIARYDADFSEYMEKSNYFKVVTKEDNGQEIKDIVFEKKYNSNHIPTDLDENRMDKVIPYIKKGLFMTPGSTAKYTVDQYLEYDKRSFCRYTKDLFYKRHIFIQTFISYSIYNPGYVITMKFFFFFSLNFFLNALLYDDELIFNRSKIENNVTFITELLYQQTKVVITSVVTIIFNLIFGIFINPKQILIDEINKYLITYDSKMMEMGKKIYIKKQKWKYSIVLTFMVLLMIFEWVYTFCFCGVYNKTALSMLYSGIYSVVISMLIVSTLKLLIHVVIRHIAHLYKNRITRFLYYIALGAL